MPSDPVRDRLRAACEQAGGVAAWARAHGLARPHVSNVLHGKARAGRILRAALSLPPTEGAALVEDLVETLALCRTQLMKAWLFRGYEGAGPLTEPATEMVLRHADLALARYRAKESPDD